MGIEESAEVREFVEATRDLLVELGILDRAETAYLSPSLMIEKMRAFDRSKEVEANATGNIKFEEILLS